MLFFSFGEVSNFVVSIMYVRLLHGQIDVNMKCDCPRNFLGTAGSGHCTWLGFMLPTMKRFCPQ